MTEDDWLNFLLAHSFTELGVSATPDWFVTNQPVNWLSQIQCDRNTAVAMAIYVVETILPEWQQNHPKDSVPVRAIEAARKCLASPTEDLRNHAKAMAKGCSASRQRSMGYYHRIAEAARAVANAASASTETSTRNAVGEALAKTEEHMLYRHAVAGRYGKEGEVRRTIFVKLIHAITL